MKKIRINELARELEVKPGVIIDLLPELGVEEKKTHSSSIDEDVALVLRQRLTGSGGPLRDIPESSNGHLQDRHDATPSVGKEPTAKASPVAEPTAETSAFQTEKAEAKVATRTPPARPPVRESPAQPATPEATTAPSTTMPGTPAESAPTASESKPSIP